MEALRTIAGTARRRPLKLLYFVVSLGVSFGFVAAVITVGHASWFRLPGAVANQSYVTALRQTATGIQLLSLRDFEEIEARVPEVSWFYVQRIPSAPIEAVGFSGASQMLNAQLVSEGFFADLGVQPGFGTLVPPDDRSAVVITDKLWRRLYGGQDVVGTLLQMQDGLSLPIIGVAPAGFVGLLAGEPDAWVMNQPPGLSIPRFTVGLDQQASRQIARLWPDVTVFGAVRDARDVDATIADVRARLAEYRFDASPIKVERRVGSNSTGGSTADTATMVVAFGFSDADRIALGRGLETAPDTRREVVRRTSWLAGVVGLLLLLVFVSVVEFLLAENVSREEEQKVRIAVGAAPMDLFRRALAENLILGFAMGLVAWFTAGYVVDVLLRVEPFSVYLREISADSRGAGLSIAGLLMALSLLVCLSYVSWFVSRSSAALTRSGRRLRRTFRQMLLFVGTASLVVVLSLVGGYVGDARLSLGFTNTDVAFVVVDRPDAAIATAANQPPAAALVEAIEAIPGVRSAAAGYLEPLARDFRLHVFARTVVGRPELADTPFFENSVTPGYFRTLGIEILAGRMFEGGRYGEVLVSRSAAEALGGIESVLGAPLVTKGDTGSTSEAMVVGVVGDVPYGDYAAAAGRPVVYSPNPGFWNHQRWLIDADAGVDVVEILGQLPEFAGWEVTLGDTPAESFRKQFLAKRSVEIVLSVASGFALVLALSGVANTLSRAIAEDRAPIGIRFALGATPGELARASLGGSLRDIAFAGVVVGAVGLAAKAAAPAFAEVLDLWLLLPTLVFLVAVCAFVIHVLIGQLARRYSVNALVNGTVAPSGTAGAGT